MRNGRYLAIPICLWALAASGIAAADELGAHPRACGTDGCPAVEERSPGEAVVRPARRPSHVRPPVGEIGTIQPKQLERPPPESAAPTPPQPAPALPSPAPITSCDPNGCRDSAGNRYNGWGPGMIRGDGKLCQQVGNMMQCN